MCVQVYVLGPKHDPSTVLSLLSDDKEADKEELMKFKHIHTCEVSTARSLVKSMKIESLYHCCHECLVTGILPHEVKSLGSRIEDMCGRPSSSKH